MRLQAIFDGKKYHNPVPTSLRPPSGYGQMLKSWLLGKEERTPQTPPGPFRADAAALAVPVPAAALRVIWLGHSTVLLEIDGRRVLTDPVWAARASPAQFMGPKRFFAPPLPLDKLPKLDAVLLSHDHYDHLDEATIRVLGRTGVPFFCPLGVGAHLRRWGVPAARITELNWWETAALGPDFMLVATPARHYSGRGLLSRDRTLWASWCLLGPQHKVFFGGDSGPFAEGFRQIGAAYGPFDLTMLEIGSTMPSGPIFTWGRPWRWRPTGCWAAGRCCRCTGARLIWRFTAGGSPCRNCRPPRTRRFPCCSRRRGSAWRCGPCRSVAIKTSLAEDEYY